MGISRLEKTTLKIAVLKARPASEIFLRKIFANPSANRIDRNSPTIYSVFPASGILTAANADAAMAVSIFCASAIKNFRTEDQETALLSNTV